MKYKEKGNDMEEEPCEICGEKVAYCSCARCILCATLYDENAALTELNDDGHCADCELEEMEL